MYSQLTSHKRTSLGPSIAVRLREVENTKHMGGGGGAECGSHVFFPDGGPKWLPLKNGGIIPMS